MFLVNGECLIFMTVSIINGQSKLPEVIVGRNKVIKTSLKIIKNSAKGFIWTILCKRMSAFFFSLNALKFSEKIIYPFPIRVFKGL